MMKGITPIIAIIVLLLITVALAGVAWSYLQGYMGGLTSKSIEVRDYFCITGDKPIIVVANIGTEAIATSEIGIMDATTGTATTGSWTYLGNATPLTGDIPISSAAKWESTS
ncbi:MAG: archaellin/type IV pilin N-terminal domain-containing protein, partial [Candidatus Aenigmatarchaeota archaeon]